jgi:hypothetical protein
MKIEYLTSMSGPTMSVKPGDVADVADKQAARLIARGYAKAVQVERAVLSAPETAVIDTRPARPAGRGNRGR